MKQKPLFKCGSSTNKEGLVICSIVFSVATISNHQSRTLTLYNLKNRCKYNKYINTKYIYFKNKRLPLSSEKPSLSPPFLTRYLIF